MNVRTTCPGCGDQHPVGAMPYTGDYHASAECWQQFTAVIGDEFADASLFVRCHQLTVDAYAAQHAGGRHRDKSVAVHLAGLHFAFVRRVPPARIAPLLQRLARGVTLWPRFTPPTGWRCTIAAVARGDRHRHADRVLAWATEVWNAWQPAHAVIADFVDRHVPPPAG
jgi:hypothetical protein